MNLWSSVGHDSTSTGLPPFDSERLSRFESFAASLRPVFHRADQVLRFRAYLRGLLEPCVRKNVESIAAAAAGSLMVEANLAQALQHFVSQSPWDARRLVSALRRGSEATRADGEAVWVIHEAAFPKKGVHSVGVHRQFHRSAGRKLNCQIGVFVSQVGPAGYFPLAARLYLPGHWLKENPELVEKCIPVEEDRRARSKVEIAFELIDELRSDGETPNAIVSESAAAADFADGLKQRGLDLVEKDEPLAVVRSRVEWMKAELGLDHFEGRTWLGWHHHVSLVFAAYYLLASESGYSI